MSVLVLYYSRHKRLRKLRIETPQFYLQHADLLLRHQVRR